MSFIALAHPTLTTIAPLDRAFELMWPEAPRFNVVDDSLYAAMDADGTITPDIEDKVARLLGYCQTAGAQAVLFTGSTFGPAVERARARLSIPVLKADEALADEVGQFANRVSILCTARRALPVITASLTAAAPSRQLDIRQVHVPADSTNLVEAVLTAVKAVSADSDAIVLGQISMFGALAAATQATSVPVFSSPAASIRRLRALLETTLA